MRNECNVPHKSLQPTGATGPATHEIVPSVAVAKDPTFGKTIAAYVISIIIAPNGVAVLSSILCASHLYRTRWCPPWSAPSCRDGRDYRPPQSMKITSVGSFALLLTLLFTSSIHAQPESGAPSGSEESIRSHENQERLAILKGDTASLERLWSETMIVNNPQSTISADRGVVLALVHKGLIRYSSFERSIEAIRIDGEIGVVMGSEVVVPVGDVPRAGQAVHRRFTNVWRMKGASWVMIARHANVIPSK